MTAERPVLLRISDAQDDSPERETAAFAEPIDRDPEVTAVQFPTAASPGVAAPGPSSPSAGAQPQLEFGIGAAGALGGLSLEGDTSLGASLGLGVGTELIAGLESRLRASTDAGDLLGKTPAALGVVVQRRNPIDTDTRVRNRTRGQVLGSGSYWVPARMDLDTLLSKIDSRIVQDMYVIKGPYSVRYGPAFDFIDVRLMPAPRYDNGVEFHGSTSADYKVNGEQWYGRQTLLAGSSDWGLRAGYGHRTGNDYTSGASVGIPSSYNSRDVDFAYGEDFGEDSSIEFNYLRLDQTGVELPGQAFDIDFLVTDGFEVTYVLRNQQYFDRLDFETWYNRTRLDGSTGPSKRRQFRFFRQNAFDGQTDVDSMSAGFRLATTWFGEAGEQLAAGADLRYLKQELNEVTSGGTFPNTWADANSPIPRSHWSNPGLFLEYANPISDRLTVSSGVRFDWVSTNVDEDEENLLDLGISEFFGAPTRSLGDILGTYEFDQDFQLWSSFVSGDYDVSKCWSARAAFGYAERPPTLTELYAAQPFMFVLQNGLNTVTGDPTLNEERLWQVDVGLQYEDGRLRSGINGFQAWLRDFITYQNIGEAPPPPRVEQVQLLFVNTHRATMTGVEWYAQYDYSDWWTPFATFRYVDARDQTRDEPLPGISPLESRVGVRLHEAAERPRWGAELTARIVDRQDRVATSLLEGPTAGFTVWDLRGYWQVSDRLLAVAGVENFTDKNYREHLDFRPISDPTGSSVFRQGVNFYFGSELSY